MKWGVTKVKHPNKGHTPNKGQKPMYQCVRYSESPLYYSYLLYCSDELLYPGANERCSCSTLVHMYNQIVQLEFLEHI